MLAHKKARPAEERPGKGQAGREGTRHVKVAPARCKVCEFKESNIFKLHTDVFSR
ncbi:hypothetical protein L614_000600001150 [Ochrobactrum sp. J50]|nr:hypothetical protein L614_000600001150 [Ochrobactrum sp. J50]